MIQSSRFLHTTVAAVVLLTVAVSARADEPPFDPTSPEDVAERASEGKDSELDLGGPDVEVESGQRGSRLPGAPGSMEPEADRMRQGGVVGILSAHCESCHGSRQQKGGLQILPLNQLFAGSDEYWVVRRGDPEASELYRRITLASDHEDIMPPKGDPMTSAEIAVVEDWIRSGASTEVRQNGRTRLRPRAWLQLYMDLELDRQQRESATGLVDAFRASSRSFEREHGRRIKQLNELIGAASSGMTAPEDLDRAKAELSEIKSGRPKMGPLQKELWELLRVDQQKALRESIAAKESADVPGSNAGRRSKPDADSGASGTLTEQERRALRDLMRRSSGDQGADSDSGSD
mgnify:CR=1 FL=1